MSKAEASKLKIGLVIDDSLDKPDGVQQYVLTLGAWLGNAGHEVHYLTTVSNVDLPHVHELSKTVKTKFNGNSGGTPLPASTRHVKQLLHDERFDVLHIQMPYSPFLAGKLIKYAPDTCRVIGTFHIFPETKLVSSATKLLGLWVRRQLKRFDACISVSTAAQEFAKQSFGLDTVVVPNMIDVAHFTVSAAKKSKKRTDIVFLGRLVERKGCMQLLEAVNYIVQRKLTKVPFHVTIGGKGALRQQCETYVAAQGLAPYVSFVGFVPEADKPGFLAQADIAVFPSLGGESFGISLLEAMAAAPGVVLAGDNAGYRTVMAGLEEQLLRPADTALFADKLVQYIEDPQLRITAQKAQYKHVQQYDTPVVAQKIIALYNG